MHTWNLINANQSTVGNLELSVIDRVGGIDFLLINC